MTRNIQFYRLTKPDGTDLPHTFPVDLLLSRLREAKAADMDLEAISDDGTLIHLEVFDHEPERPFVVLYRPRRSNQGHMNDNGEIKPMPFDDGQHIRRKCIIQGAGRRT